MGAALVILQFTAGADESPPKPFFHVYQEWSHSLEELCISQNEWTTWIMKLIRK
jgi:hypothetical protein